MEDITIEDLPNEFIQHFAELFGVDNAIQLMNTFGGEYVYIPLVRKNYSGIRRKIFYEYKRHKRNTVTVLAKQYKISRKYVYKILKQNGF